MPYAPGESGNPEGRRVEFGKFRAALDRAIAQDDSKALRRSAERLLALAADGDLQAIAMLADRLDGKARQSIDADVNLRGLSQVLAAIDGDSR